MPDACDALIEFYKEFFGLSSDLFAEAVNRYDDNKADGIFELRWKSSLSLCDHLIKRGCNTAEIKATSGKDCETYRKWEEEEERERLEDED